MWEFLISHWMFSDQNSWLPTTKAFSLTNPLSNEAIVTGIFSKSLATVKLGCVSHRNNKMTTEFKLVPPCKELKVLNSHLQKSIGVCPTVFKMCVPWVFAIVSFILWNFKLIPGKMSKLCPSTHMVPLHCPFKQCCRSNTGQNQVCRTGILSWSRHQTLMKPCTWLSIPVKGHWKSKISASLDCSGKFLSRHLHWGPVLNQWPEWEQTQASNLHWSRPEPMTSAGAGMSRWPQQEQS